MGGVAVAELEAEFTEEFQARKSAFVGQVQLYRVAQYYQARVQTSMEQNQMMIMARGQQEAQSASNKAKQLELMAKCNDQLHMSFDKNQLELFLTFRKALVQTGAGHYIDAAVTERAEARLQAAQAEEPEPAPEPEEEQSWGAWLASGIDSVATAVGSALGDEEDEGGKEAAAQPAAPSQLLSCDGKEVIFERGAFGATAAALSDVKVVRADPFTCAPHHHHTHTLSLHVFPPRLRAGCDSAHDAGRACRAHTAIANASAISGHIALVVRGEASFAEKATAVQQAGAVGMICANTEDVLGRLVGNAPVRTHTPSPNPLPSPLLRLHKGCESWRRCVGAQEVTIPCVCIKSSDLDTFTSESLVSLKYS